jgi:hypothetical protein
VFSRVREKSFWAHSFWAPHSLHVVETDICIYDAGMNFCMHTFTLRLLSDLPPLRLRSFDWSLDRCWAGFRRALPPGPQTRRRSDPFMFFRALPKGRVEKPTTTTTTTTTTTDPHTQRKFALSILPVLTLFFFSLIHHVRWKTQ